MKDILEKFCSITTNYYYSNPKNFDSIFNGGNEMRPSVKEGKYKIFTFADRDEKRILGMKNLKYKLERYSIVDEVKVFNLSDVDKNFIDKHQSLFSSNIFPWISKAYLMNKWLDESDDGDVIFWIDSDVVDIREDGIVNIFNLCNNSEKGIVGFHNDYWLERLFTKSDLFNYLNITDNKYWDTNQAYGGIFVVKRNEFTLKFFRRWFEICSIIPLMDNSKSKSRENPHFITHKNDQSILSLLYKLNNIKTFPLPLYDCNNTNIIAIHSGYFNHKVSLPLVWESCWHNISYKEMWENCNKKFNKKVSPSECLSLSTDYFKNYD
jgi:hypothetical protein